MSYAGAAAAAAAAAEPKQVWRTRSGVEVRRREQAEYLGRTHLACWHLVMWGSCEKGVACDYAHGRDVARAALRAVPLCPFYANRDEKCRFERLCVKRHGDAAPGSLLASLPSTATRRASDGAYVWPVGTARCAHCGTLRFPSDDSPPPRSDGGGGVAGAAAAAAEAAWPVPVPAAPVVPLHVASGLGSMRALYVMRIRSRLAHAAAAASRPT